MKVVQVNTICGVGSVGRICVDLYETIKKEGVEPYIAVGRGGLSPGICGYVIGNKPDFFCHVFKNFFQGKAGFGSKKQTALFLSWLDEIRPDLIHLHNIHGFYLQVEMLFDYIKKRKIPVVWTLHDCWPFTGHCAYFDYIGCEKWKEDGEGCNHCRIHRRAYPYAIFKDNSQDNFAQKKRIFSGVENLTIVTPSRWLMEKVQASFLKEYPVEVIPNGIDLSVFSPLSKEKQILRQKQNEGYKHRTVLGVANRWEERKGLSYFEELAKRLPDHYTIELLGLDKAQTAQIRKKYPSGKLLPIDRTRNVELLASIYRTADVYVNATLEDNFPTTNLEALACGTPVITFATGGSPESINEKCGVVVKKKDVEGLVEAVRMVCEEKPFLVDDCRKQAMNFGKNERYHEYFELYLRMLAEKKETS